MASLKAELRQLEEENAVLRGKHKESAASLASARSEMEALTAQLKVAEELHQLIDNDSKAGGDVVSFAVPAVLAMVALGGAVLVGIRLMAAARKQQ